MTQLLSSPNENYQDHIERASGALNAVLPRFLPALRRILPSTTDLLQPLRLMVHLHDLGKLTRRWQEDVGSGRRLPAHAAIGAAHLWSVLPDDLKGPLSFAVAIHHSDRGLLGDNIEKPDVQAILSGVVNSGTELMEWADGCHELSEELYPAEAKSLMLEQLRQFARGLRQWARGCSYLEQHRRRMQVSLAHHVLKLADISAASQRKNWEGEEKELDESDLYGGWLMVRQIDDYVCSLSESKEAK